MTRFFHLLSDNKTVAEIDSEQYKKLASQNIKSDRAFKLLVVHDTELLIYHRQTVWVSRDQLEKVLEECWK